MGELELGELKDVPVRKVWKHEAHNFTPWLADNLNRLSATLGLELELEGTEVVLGRYKADIVCRDPADDTKVIIENQLEPADLQHLGQVLAYLTSSDAKVVVWIAKEFRDEHLAALSWLNKHTPNPFAFFAVTVRAVKIGDSLPAPLFSVIEGPNDWDRELPLTELGTFRRDFWAHLGERRPHAPRLRRGYAASNVKRRLEELDVNVGQYISTSGAGMFIKAGAGESKESMLTRLKPYLEPLQDALRNATEADGLGEVEDHTFGDDTESNFPCSIWLGIDSKDRDNWDQVADWLDDRRQVYEAVLRNPPSQVG